MRQMRKFVLNLIDLGITLVLALGWTWTGYLKDRLLISDKQVQWILIAITIVLVLQKVYSMFPKPVNRGVVEARKELVVNSLSELHAEYYKILRSNNKKKEAPLPTVRVNVMLPTKQFKGLLGSHLKMYYYVCPKGIIYNDQELDLKWQKKRGTCGWAWDKKDISIYDSKNPDYKQPEARLKEKHRAIVKDIHSTLSVPIWYNNKVSGVLNLDSQQNLDETLFALDRVYLLASACAVSISGHCFEDGVEA